MAEVHLAIQRGPAGFEKLVVLKLVHEHLAAEAAFAQMLLDEARHAGMIKHPNVVEIYELGEEAGRHFIVMEYLPGEPLLEVLRIAGEGGARLDALSIARVIADTAEGLDAAHRLTTRDGRPLELVHHDVSMGNIVVLYSGLVKLVDFGVAKAQRTPGGPRVHGKLGYMSPEKVQDAAVDRRSDIWSLGCVLWEALTLRRLFKGDTDADTVRQVLGAPIAPPSEIEPSAPPELDPIVMRALQRDPDRRYQTAKGMAADLEEVLREAGYGAKNDRIAQHMESVFAARIAARERVLLDVSHEHRPSAATLEAAFGEAMTYAARTITSTGHGPVAPAGEEEEEEEERAHEAATTKTPPNAPAWRPPPDAMAGAAVKGSAAVPPAAQAAAAAPPGTGLASDFEEPLTETAIQAVPSPPTPTIAAAGLGPPASITPAAAAAPAPTEAPPDGEAAPDAPPPEAEGAAAAPPAPRAPIVPSIAPPPPWQDEPNPFADDDDFKTVADVIPANAEASRSLQSEPSWTVARQSAALDELQRWVQESRNPPQSRWEALVRKVRPWHQRVVSWAFQRRVPPWSPYAAAGVVLLLLVLLIARCATGGSDARPGKPAASAGSAQTEPREPGAAPAGGETEMEEDANAVRPPKQR